MQELVGSRYQDAGPVYGDLNVQVTGEHVERGIRNEPVALLKYQQALQCCVLETGLHIHKEHSFLGASPDGLVVHGVGSPGVLLSDVPVSDVSLSDVQVSDVLSSSSSVVKSNVVNTTRKPPNDTNTSSNNATISSSITNTPHNNKVRSSSDINPTGSIPSQIYTGCVEVKCPFRQVHSSIPLEYMCQIQAQLEIIDVDICDFVSFHVKSQRTRVIRVERSRPFWGWMYLRLRHFFVCLQVGEFSVYADEEIPEVVTRVVYESGC